MTVLREFSAPCAEGFEQLLAQELKSLGCERVRPLTGSVSFFSTILTAYRACMFSRLASRILMIVDRVDARDADELYQQVQAIDWEAHFDPARSFAVRAHGANQAFNNTQFVSYRVKDAIVDLFRTKTGCRPEVDPRNPDLLIDVRLRSERATIAIDLSGESLHKRGYKTEHGHDAPLKEGLADLVLYAAGWHDQDFSEPVVFLDPFCGTGTLAIEAALIALDRAPGMLRPEQAWGFTGWLGHDAALWQAVCDEAHARAQAAQDRASNLKIVARDIDKRAIEMSRKHAHRAGLAQIISFVCCDVTRDTGFAGCNRDATLVVATNPPYAERMGVGAEQPVLAAALFSLVKKLAFQTTRIAVISPYEGFEHAWHHEPDKVLSVKNGPLQTAVRCITMSADEPADLVPGTEQFRARLAKVQKERAAWAEREAIDAYRVYDADLPDYNLAIDVLQDCRRDGSRQTYLHVAEYQAPKKIDPAKTARRLFDALRVLMETYGVDARRVFVKRRQKAKGGSQYAKVGKKHEDAQDKSSTRIVTQEGGLLFGLNLSDYLDYGLFLDHRMVRELVREYAKGKKSFLNLFCYTASATCYAIDGMIERSESVDLSRTYLKLAERNLRLNGFTSDGHQLIQADVLQWVREARHKRRKFDLIFIDPPTFSNSSRMRSRSFDIQRDHVQLLVDVSRLLGKDGKAIFSCNLSSFVPDYKALEKARVKLIDITAQTIPHDFERHARIHHCFELTLLPPR